MSLDVWFKEDIANTLRSLYLAHKQTASRAEQNDKHVAYQEGYADGLRAVSVAFGLYKELIQIQRDGDNS